MVKAQFYQFAISGCFPYNQHWIHIYVDLSRVSGCSIKNIGYRYLFFSLLNHQTSHFFSKFTIDLIPMLEVRLSSKIHATSEVGCYGKTVSGSRTGGGGCKDTAPPNLH